MKQTIRFFRKKKDDVWAIFLAEYFKMIGCIVTEIVLPEEQEYDSVDFEGQYDANLLFGTVEDKISGIALGIQKAEETNLEGLRTQGEQVLMKAIKNIWHDQNIVQDLTEICQLYCKHDMFYYLYHKGNLKFVQEFYPLFGREQKEGQGWQDALTKTFEQFAAFYNSLVIQEETKNTLSQYYEYSILKMKYKLNEVGRLIGKGLFFSTDTMLEQIKAMQERNPEFVRLNYLKAKICTADSRYIWDGEFYFRAAIVSARAVNKDETMRAFLYYQLGRYYEKSRKDARRAKECYNQAYKCNFREYRSVYKIAKVLAGRGHLKEAIENLNQVIKMLLNGYEMEEMMPKQQVYLYKCFVMMGDIYFREEVFDLARISYKRALAMSKTTSFFFGVLGSEGGFRCFKEMMKLCMPKQPVYLKLIRCSSEYRDQEEAVQYYMELTEL